MADVAPEPEPSSTPSSSEGKDAKPKKLKSVKKSKPKKDATGKGNGEASPNKKGSKHKNTKTTKKSSNSKTASASGEDHAEKEAKEAADTTGDAPEEAKVSKEKTKVEPSAAGTTKGSSETQPITKGSTKSVKRKHVPMMCGCCKSFVRVPQGAAKFTCVLCRVVTFTKGSQRDELKALYEKYDWSDYVKQVRCPRCQLLTYIPKRAFMFTCFDCGSINDSDGLRLGVRRNGSQDHAAVFGLSELTMQTPWLFWSFFFKGAMTEDNIKPQK